jgi:hypothetical protein
MKSSDDALLKLLSKNVTVDFYMLCTLMKHQVGYNMKISLTVTKNQSFMRMRKLQVTK